MVLFLKKHLMIDHNISIFLNIKSFSVIEFLINDKKM